MLLVGLDAFRREQLLANISRGHRVFLLNGTDLYILTGIQVGVF